MKIIIAEDKEKVGLLVSEKIVKEINNNPEIVLGLATGSTPLPIYRNLVNLYNKGLVDFSKVKTFNLDEYVGLKNNDINSYHFFMNDILFKHININTKNTFIPKGVGNLENNCLSYEKLIKKNGGIDLQILGIGSNGHIAFNEPPCAFESRTHITNLLDSTINDNAKNFSSIEQVPRQSITMGIETIMEAKQIILVATGSNKSNIIEKLVYGDITVNNPASILKKHPNVIVYLDKKAGKKIKENFND